MILTREKAGVLEIRYSEINANEEAEIVNNIVVTNKVQAYATIGYFTPPVN